MRSKSDAGFTLIEIAMVVVIIALLSSVVVARMTSVSKWRVRGQVREFAHTWQFLFGEALSRGQTYRLVLDLDRDSYFVRQEISLPPSNTHQVDRLKNLRSKKEQSRRDRKEEDQMLSLNEEFEEEAKSESLPLEQLFARTIYSDPEADVRLSRPLDLPSLGDETLLPEDLHIRDVRIRSENFTEGRAIIRFSPRGGSEFAVVHLAATDFVFTIYLNPVSGEMQIFDGDRDVEWKGGRDAT